MECVPLSLSDGKKAERVNEILEPLMIDNETAQKIIDIFITDVGKGLESGLQYSSLQMENTYITDLMNGTEKGQYLALDLGGTNFRIILLEIEEGKITREEVEYYTVDELCRMGRGEDLFEFLAECIYDFLKKNNLEKVQIPLGFTFSFPVIQSSLISASLITWTKSFMCSGVVGNDVVYLLNKALRKKNIVNVHIVAILNDTTGTLVKGSYDDPNTCIGLILGTGFNCAYLEKSEKVDWISRKPDAREVIVDPEVGAFGDTGCLHFLRSEFDRELDLKSLLPGSFTYEKKFAGKYIGELARLILLKLAKEGVAFIKASIPKLEEKDCFTSSDLSDIEGDYINNKDENCQIILQRLGIEPMPDDVTILKYVCKILSHRCGLLVALPLSVLLKRMQKPKAAIAVTGSLYKFHPRLKKLLEMYLKKFAGNCQFYTFLSDDGSGKGAGLVAAITSRLKSGH